MSGIHNDDHRVSFDTHTHNSDNSAFGYHLMLDCYQCSLEKLDSIDSCYEFLNQLVEEIGAQKQTQPYVFRTPENFKGKEGLSGWAPIVESGISIHTLTKSLYISLDVYSCRRFDNNKVISFTKDFFSVGEIEVNFVLRGVKHSG